MTLFTIFMIGMSLVSCSKEINESSGDRALGNMSKSASTFNFDQFPSQRIFSVAADLKSGE